MLPLTGGAAMTRVNKLNESRTLTYADVPFMCAPSSPPPRRAIIQAPMCLTNMVHVVVELYNILSIIVTDTTVTKNQ